MKKLGILITTILLALLLVSCSKDKFRGKVTFVKSDDPIGETSVDIELKIEDPNNQIEGQITVYVIKKGQTERSKETSKTKEQFKEEHVLINSLEEKTTYTLYVETNINGKKVAILVEEFTTKTQQKFDITTTEEFFGMKSNLYATYTLKNDLDFTDVHTSIIGTFRGKFYGEGFTIKNYKVSSSNSTLGLFSQLSQSAVVENLIIDGFNLKKDFGTETRKDEDGNTIMEGTEPKLFPKTSGTSSYIGVLFGQNASSNTKVNNITIKNTHLDLELDTSSNYLKLGILGGVASGSFENINIEENNILDVKLRKHHNIQIGGVIGQLNDTAKLTKVKSAGEINVSVDQLNENGLEGKDIAMQIGGVSGAVTDAIVNNVVSSTNINLEKVNYVVDAVGEYVKDKPVRNLNISIGGIFGQLSARGLIEGREYRYNNIVYSGNIKVLSETTYTLDLKETNDDGEEKPVTLKYKYAIKLRVGGLFGTGNVNYKYLKNVIRAGGEFSVVTQNEEHATEIHVLNTNQSFAESTDEFYGFAGTIKDTYGDTLLTLDELFMITDYLSLFEGNDWMKEALK